MAVSERRRTLAPSPDWLSLGAEDFEVLDHVGPVHQVRQLETVVLIVVCTLGQRGRSMHQGLDIAAPRGTPIYSTADGVVTFVGRQRGYGIVVKIRHAFGFETIYAHNSRARVNVGQRVSRGDRIADMGSTGRSSGNHVHYEIRIDSKPVNPVKFIKAVRNVL